MEGSVGTSTALEQPYSQAGNRPEQGALQCLERGMGWINPQQEAGSTTELLGFTSGTELLPREVLFQMLINQSQAGIQQVPGVQGSSCTRIRHSCGKRL